MIRQNRAFNPFMACTQVNAYHGDKLYDRMPDQWKMGVSCDKNMTDERQDNNSKFEALKNKVMQSREKSRSGEIRLRSGYIYCRAERLGIQQ